MSLIVTQIPERIWLATWEGLRARSANGSESACVWGGKRDGGVEVVESAYFLDDLPGISRGRLHHVTSRHAIKILFERLRDQGQQIVADVHAHPSMWVGMSEVDQENPIEFRVGLLALIFPNFGTGPSDIHRVGTHVYLGRGQWKQLHGSEIGMRLKILNSL